MLTRVINIVYHSMFFVITRIFLSLHLVYWKTSVILHVKKTCCFFQVKEISIPTYGLKFYFSNVFWDEYIYNPLPIIIVFSGLTQVDISDVDEWYLFDKDQKKKGNNSFLDIFIDGTRLTASPIPLLAVVIGKKNIVLLPFGLISYVVYRLYY